MNEQKETVNHPNHYNQYQKEVIELVEKLGFDLGNCAKYILRAPYKGREKEDLEKAKWYLRHMVDDYTAEECRAQIIRRDGNFSSLLCSFRCALVTEIVLACGRGDKPGLNQCLGRLADRIKAM